MKKELNEQQRRELNTESFKASEESQMNEEEWQARIDLAALYRLAAHFGYDDLIWNHITMRVPGTDHQFLLNKFGRGAPEHHVHSSSARQHVALGPVSYTHLRAHET